MKIFQLYELQGAFYFYFTEITETQNYNWKWKYSQRMWKKLTNETVT